MCRGTVNMEDVYLIDVSNFSYEHQTKLRNPEWIKHHGGISVDKCIGKEVEFLIKKGVITLGSCCRHGEYDSHCLVSEESRELLESMGYKLYEYSDIHTRQGIYEIKLKGCFKNING